MTSKKKSGEGESNILSTRARVRGKKLKPNPEKEMYTPEQIIEALQKADGFISYAAKSLGCNRTTVYTYINKYPTVKEVHEQENEILGDEIEHDLMVVARDEKHKDRFNSLKFIAQTKYKKRGYGSSLDLTHEFEVPEGFKITTVNAPRKQDADS